MLKALFGTNIVSQWEPQQLPNLSYKPGKATRMTGNVKPGLYYYCFTQPYAHFTQSLAGATFKATSQAEPEDSLRYIIIHTLIYANLIKSLSIS